VRRRIPDGHVRWGTFLRMWKRRKKPQKPQPRPGDFLSNLDAYGRQVVLYYDGSEHREFKRLVGELAEKFGTKTQSYTVLYSLKALMTVPKRVSGLS